MKRRTLDVLFSVGGVGLAGLLLLMGIVMSGNANFSEKYVTDQLTQEKITFKAAAALTDEEKKSDCLATYAGQHLSTGKQAECYANDFIGLHVKSTAGGKTYAEIGDSQSALRTQIAAAQSTNDSSVADLQKQLTDLTGQRETVFKGETLRGILLTSYGFSVLGTKAHQAATVIYLGAGLVMLLSLAGFAHALATPTSQAFAAPDARPEAIGVPEVTDVETAPSGLTVLEEAECLALLEATPVGRLGIVADGQPFVFPVNYVFDQGSIVLRTAIGTKLGGASLARVAFEIDSFDPANRSGWSVMVEGIGHDITGALDETSERLQTVEVLPWAPGSKPRLLRIDPTTVTGRRFGGEPDPGGD